MSRTPLFLCHACDTVYAHAGTPAVAASLDHAREEHPHALTGAAPPVTFTDLGTDPWVLLARPRSIDG